MSMDDSGVFLVAASHEVLNLQTDLVLAAGLTVAGRRLVDNAPLRIEPERVWIHDVVDTGHLDRVSQLWVSDGTLPTKWDLDFELWSQRLKRMFQPHQRRDIQVLMLASSTGGPAAVSELLQALPVNNSLAIVWVQHHSPSTTKRLVESVNSGAWPMKALLQDSRIETGQVNVVSSDEKLDRIQGARIGLVGAKWNGEFSPSIDHCAGVFADYFGPKLSVYIMTGLSGEGVLGASLAKLKNCDVWVQPIEHCLASGMPQDVLNRSDRVSELSIKNLVERFTTETIVEL